MSEGGGDDHTIRPRRVTFDWSGTPRHWVGDDPVNTHVINVLHLLLPAGERWFCNVYRQALPRVKEAKLRADVKGFIGQEAVHARAHATVLEHLATQGVETGRYTRQIEWMFERLLGDGSHDGGPRWLADEWLKLRLAYIAAIEHFTCVLGAWVIEAEGLEGPDVDPTMVDLLRWHGAEEVEHRSVAYDLYQHVSGGYPRRVMGMVVVAPMMAFLWAMGTLFLLRQDPTVENVTWRRALRGFRRGVRQGRVPSLALLLRAVPRYMKPSHHPSDEGSVAAALAYLASSPATRRWGSAAGAARRTST